MKCAISILVLLVVGQVVEAQEKKPWDVDRLCGRLEHIQRTPSRRDANSLSEKRKALRDVPMSLLERHETEVCCNGLTPIETVQTGKGGNFDFKNMKQGSYWLTTNWSGREYKLAVVYKPQKNSATSCSEQGIQVDDGGNADWWVTITVD